RHEADASAARHVFKRHGREETELPRGQLPVKPDDWAMIPDILAAPDQVRVVKQGRAGQNRIGYWKQFNGHFFYVEQVETGRGDLTAKIMEKQKGKFKPVPE